MTETEFNDLDLSKDVAEMEEDEAKKTLSEFMEAHKKNRTAYDQLNSELDEVETEYTEKLEEKEELISDFTQERAEEAAEFVKLPADLIADRFTLEEIDQIIDEGSEFSDEEGDETDEEEEDDTITTFSEKPEKGKGGGGQERTANRDRARDILSRNGFTASGGN